MTREQVTQYYQKMDQWQSGKITDNEWYMFCTVILGELLDENRDVLIRLKEGG